MKSFKTLLLEIVKEDKSIIVLVLLNFLLASILFIVGMFSLSPNSAVVKIAYGDVGGYVDGKWADMLVFPIFAVIVGVVHGLMSFKIFEKYDKNYCKIFLVVSMLLVVGAMFVLIRLLQEG